MAAPWLLLEPHVVLIDEGEAAEKDDDGEPIYQLIGCWAGLLMVEDEAPFGGQSERVALKAAATRGAGKQPAAGGSVGEQHRMAQAIQLFAHFADPPEVSRFALVLSEPEKEVKTSFLTSIDQSRFLFNAGPSFTSWRRTGYYLIHDAAKNSLTVIPEMPLAVDDCILGGRAVLLHGEEEGAHVLAELMFNNITRGFILWLWKSSTAQWIREVTNIPGEVNPLSFRVEKTFSFQGSCFCWADLFQGILICDMSGTNPRFRFIPLPAEHVYDPLRQGRIRPVELRNMSCINGSIKFVCIDNKRPASVNIMKLESLDPVKWTIISDLCFEELWADDSFNESKVPMWVPVFPTLSLDDDGIIYFLVDQWCQRYNDWDVDLKDNGIMVGVNLQTKKLTSCSHYQSAIMPVPVLLSRPAPPT